MNKLLIAFAALLLLGGVVATTAVAAVQGTAGVGDQCDVNAEDASHTCSTGLVCVPQNENSEGNGKCQSVTPSVTPTCDPEEQDCVTPTPTVPVVTETPGNGGGPGDGLGCSTHDCSNQGSSNGPIQAVLGASTMAGTGTFSNSLMAAMLIAGIAALSLGGISFLKENK